MTHFSDKRAIKKTKETVNQNVTHLTGQRKWMIKDKTEMCDKRRDSINEKRQSSRNQCQQQTTFLSQAIPILSLTNQLWLSNLIYMQMSFLLVIPEGWLWMDCVPTHTIVCACARVREKEGFSVLFTMSPSIGPLDLTQRQLKTGSNLRHRPAINLPSIPWTCHIATFVCPLPPHPHPILETWCWEGIFL